MRCPQRLSLRLRIAAGVLAGLVVLFSFFGFLAFNTINLTTDAALEQRLLLAQIGAESVDELIAHTAQQLERTAARVADVAAEEEQRRQVEEVFDLLGEFDRIVHLGPEGGVAWIIPQQTDDDWLFREDAAVQAALGRTETSIIAPTRRIPADDLAAILVAPLDPRDRSAGFLAGELRASHADVSLLTLPQGEGSFRSEIVDAAGYVVAQTDDGDPSPRDEHAEILTSIIASGRPARTIHHGGDSPDHLVAYYPFRSLPGGIVVEQTEDAALVVPREMQQMMLVYGIAALLIASAAAWLHAGSVVRPIQRLTGSAARMASGDLESPIAVSRDDEIGHLARSFDEMRVKLKVLLEDRARWAEELERRVQEATREVDEQNRELNALNRIRRQLLARAISAQEEERKRLARELHDDSAQTLTAVLMRLKAAEDALPAVADEAKRTLEWSRSQLEAALREIRKAILDLRPSALDDLGLAAAVRWYAHEHLRPLGTKVVFKVVGDEQRAAGADATAIFRIAQEAVNNIARHSGARHATIILEFGPADVLAVIKDDGDGFDPEGLQQSQEDGRGLGILGMRERAELFGGDVEIESSAGRGTSLRIRIPYA